MTTSLPTVPIRRTCTDRTCIYTVIEADLDLEGCIIMDEVDSVITDVADSVIICTEEDILGTGTVMEGICTCAVARRWSNLK